MFYQRFSHNKYNNVKQTYKGYSYDSKRESIKAWELDSLLKSKQIKSYDKQVKEELFGQNCTRVCNYFCDFKIEHNDGTIEFLEIKAPITKTPIFNLKWKLLQDKYKKDCNYKFTIEM